MAHIMINQQGERMITQKTLKNVHMARRCGMVIWAISFFFIILVLAGCASTPPTGIEPVELVDSVDLERYIGLWYEIARIPNRFEKNIYAPTAEYTLRNDGKIRVVNSGFKGGLDGKYTEVMGVAWIPDPNELAALKVSFFWPFASDYMIIGLDTENYDWAVVGNNSREFLWFLARTHEIDETLHRKMEEIAGSQGFDIESLDKVPQKPR